VQKKQRDSIVSYGAYEMSRLLYFNPLSDTSYWHESQNWSVLNPSFGSVTQLSTEDQAPQKYDCVVFNSFSSSNCMSDGSYNPVLKIIYPEQVFEIRYQGLCSPSILTEGNGRLSVF